ncbi:drug/metabolite transporter (DMT)-like permease [Peptoniphilus koenoeneniae]|uniref:Drug/metabolite transporter (DMT)-like permease n=1 Tax=Peptoniphilus koenoeneniae TaxID=507751 RepID=A0ABU0AYD6_9FIRM|nr:EamA-like transporter family protein [Peptoniphilus sp. BV3C26]MDQ0275418.1 drug/metabolite transporter (DMT)-like permease [Peptoniphilus koenoeneniae]
MEKNKRKEMEEKREKGNLGKLFLLIVAILWGSSLTFVKVASATFKPNMILATRFTISVIILGIIFWKKIKKMTKDDLKSGLIIGVFLFLAYSVQTVGVGYTDPGRSAFLSASYCVIVPFISWFAIKKRPDKFNLIAAVFCIIGIYFVSMTGGNGGSVLERGKEAILGDAFAILSGFLFASHIVAVAKFSKGKDPILMTILQFFMAAVLSCLATLIFEDNSGLVITKEAILEVSYLAVMCTTVALLLQNIGQKYASASSSAIILALESVFGILIPVLIGIEALTKHTIIGFVMIFLAIIISETKLSFLGLGQKNKKFI